MKKDSKATESIKQDAKTTAEILKEDAKLASEDVKKDVKKDVKNVEEASEKAKKDVKEDIEKVSEKAKKDVKSTEKELKSTDKTSKKSKKKEEAEKAKREADLEVRKSTSETGEVLKVSALLAEVIGTFVLTGAVIKLAAISGVGMFAVSFILLLLVMLFGPISGAHLNPAVTVALCLNKQVSAMKAVAYIIAQLIGAALALLLFKYLWEAGVMSALLSGGVEKSVITSDGGPIKYLESIAEQLKATGQNYSVGDLISQFGLSDFPNVAIAKGSEVFTFIAELLGALIFGLGIGHAVFAKDKSMFETGFSVGFGLFAAAGLAGSTAVLNPAVGLAIGAFETTGANMWAGYLIYILVTCIGMYAGVTAYRFLFVKALED